MSFSNINTLSSQRSYERLQMDADRLFDIGWLIRRLTWEIRERFSSEDRRPWQQFFRELRTSHELWFAWEMLHAHTKSLHKIIDWQRLFPDRDQLVSQLQEEREQQIREFSRLMISKRWDTLKDDDTSWRKFAKVMFSLKETRETTEQFFELTDYIYMLTLVILGKESPYFTDTTDDTRASTTSGETGEAPYPGAIEARAELKLFLKEAWFDKFCVDKKRYDLEWREAFVNDMLDSPTGKAVIDDCTSSRNQKVKGAIIGCLKKAGVLDDKKSNLSIASFILSRQQDTNLTEAEIMKKNNPLSSYIGNYIKPEFNQLRYWVLEWVKKKQAEA
jgi:hypothetical protein